jgi:hypothetical protein
MVSNSDFAKMQLQQHKKRLNDAPYYESGDSIQEIVLAVISSVKRRIELDIEIHCDTKEFEDEKLINEFEQIKLKQLIEFEEKIKKIIMEIA